MEYLAQLGTEFWSVVMAPTLLWTLLVYPVWMVLRRIEMHPTAAYYQLTVLYFSLPVSVVAVFALGLLFESGWFSGSMLGSETLVGGLIVLQELVVGPSAGSSWMMGVAGVVALFVAGSAVWGVVELVYAIHTLSRYEWSGAMQADLGAYQRLDRVRAQMGVQKSVHLYRSSETEVPFTYGHIRPVIVLPESMSEDANTETILIHEMVHIRRADYLTHIVERLVYWMFAGHPLLRVMGREIQDLREMSVDAEVLARTEGKASDYARILFDFAYAKQEPRLSAALSMAVKESKVKERITQMSRFKRTESELLKTRRNGVWSAMAVMVLTVGMVACTESAFSPSTGDTDGSLSSTDISEIPVTTPRTVDGEPEVFIVVEKMPEPIGGMKAIYDRVTYPEAARTAGVEGRVVVQFVVDKEGNVVDPQIIRGIGGGCDEAALEAVKGVKFTPGTQRGQNVAVQFQLPIVFRLS
jgi:TonB family protein